MKADNKMSNHFNKVAEETERVLKALTPSPAPYVTVVTYKGGMKFHGHFESFSDRRELLEIGRARFIPSNLALEFRDSIAKTGEVNFLKYSVIIDLTITAHIALVNLNNGHVLKSVVLIEEETEL